MYGTTQNKVLHTLAVHIVCIDRWLLFYHFLFCYYRLYTHIETISQMEAVVFFPGSGIHKDEQQQIKISVEMMN